MSQRPQAVAWWSSRPASSTRKEGGFAEGSVLGTKPASAPGPQRLPSVVLSGPARPGPADPHCSQGTGARGHCHPSPHLAHPGGLSPGLLLSPYSLTPSQAQGPSLLGETPGAHLPLPRRSPCSPPPPPPQPTDHGSWSFGSGREGAFPAGAGVRVAGPGCTVTRSQI